MKQVVVIHGGESYANYEDYLEYLRTTPIDLARSKTKRWKSTLPEALGEGYEVIAPSMPNSVNAKYEEWQIWFERHIPFLEDGVILLGHSLGGMFLAKYLGENSFAKKIRATFIVAAPYDDNGNPDIAGFAPPHDLSNMGAQGGEIFLYHSTNDPIVPYTELAKYQKALSTAIVRTFTDRGHFDQEHFAELVADIQAL